MILFEIHLIKILRHPGTFFSLFFTTKIASKIFTVNSDFRKDKNIISSSSCVTFTR